MIDRPTEFNHVLNELSTRTAGLSTALRAALAYALPADSGARACGRALGLKRSMGWQVYSVAYSTDASTVLRALPRSNGWHLILRSLEVAGCPASLLVDLRAKIKSMEALLSGARIDRAMIRAAAAGSLDSVRERQATRRNRRAATLANERIYGISARATMLSVLLGPVSKEGKFDGIACTILHEIRRFRTGSPWPVYLSSEVTESRDRSMRTGSRRSLKGDGGPFVEELSTPGIARSGLLQRRRGNAVVFELAHGADGCRDAVRLCFWEHIARAGTSGDVGQRSELHLSTNMPMSVAAFEVFIHRSHRILSQPSASLAGSPRVFGTFPDPPENLRLPLEVDAEPIDKPTLPTALRGCEAERDAMLKRSAESLHAPLSDFVGFRVVVHDPPIHSRIVLAWRM
jgi:hypothetical protein